TETEPQGDATLYGAKYELYNSGAKVASLTALPDSRTVKSGVLPLGVYDIIETDTPNGYLPPESNSPATSVQIPYVDMYTPIVDSDGIVKSYVIKGIISIGKFSGHDLSGELPDGVKLPLENVAFTVALKSGSVIATTITTNADGKAATGLLPYGVYTITETVGIEGFDVVAPFECFVSVNNHEYWYYLQDNIVDRYLRVEKTDTETGNVIKYWMQISRF
ncbi:MAG: prealbumin-like fold domain-containing protein, partial [Christensenellaceae bacterium]